MLFIIRFYETKELKLDWHKLILRLRDENVRDNKITEQTYTFE